MTLEEAKAKANEAMDLLLKIGSKMMEENEKYIQENCEKVVRSRNTI